MSLENKISRRKFLEIAGISTLALLTDQTKAQAAKQLKENYSFYGDYEEVLTPIANNPYQAIEGLPAEMQFSGVVAPNAEVFNELDAHKIITVNLVDGSTGIFTRAEDGNWIQIPISEELNIMNAYAVIGRELSANPVLTEMYSNSEFSKDGSRYDGEHGVWWTKDGIPRTTYTPALIAQLHGFGYVDDFGLIGGKTDIAFINQMYLDEEGNIAEYDDQHSNYTIHRVPEAPDQDIRLREPDLIRANTDGVPVPYPTLHRSSGCVNYDAETWFRIKNTLSNFSNENMFVVFTYPSLDQDVLLKQDPFLGNDPFSNRNIYGEYKRWNYADPVNRRGYFLPAGQEG